MNYRQRALSAAIAVLVLPACVSIKTVPLVGGRSPSLEGKSITLAARPMPAFGLVSSSKMFAGALFGGLGMGAVAASGMSAGRETARQNQLEDPAVAAGKSLLGELASNNCVFQRS